MTTRQNDGETRLCPECSSGYIFGDDFHPRCVGCMGAEHAGLALTPRASCHFCKRLSLGERRQRADFFVVCAEEIWQLGDDAPPAATSSTVSHVPVFAHSTPEFQLALDPDSDGSASTAGLSPPASPLHPLPAEEPEQPGPAAIPAKDRLVVATSTTPLPAMGQLLQELPDVIRSAAERCGLPAPPALVQDPQESANFGRYNPRQAPRRIPVWPRSPAIAAYFSAAAEAPAKLKAPVSTYSPITQVDGFTVEGFPTVPPLEPSLASFFGAKCVLRAGRRTSPPSSKDVLAAGFADRSHQCAYQVAAAANNIVVMAHALSELAGEPNVLPHACAEEVSKMAGSILSLSAPIMVAAARIAAWQTLVHRNIWLHVSQIPEAVRQEFLEGPISNEGLFGPRFHALVKELQSAEEEAEKVRRHVTGSPRPLRKWWDRRDQRQFSRRPAPPAAIVSQPPPPSRLASQPQANQRKPPKPSRLAASWSNPPPGPPRKQRKFGRVGGGCVFF